jgi:lipoate---protein ligase
VKMYAPAGVMDVYRALALENVFLDDATLTEPLLFCWVGDAAVVMGKNQNPWRECNLPVIRGRKLKLARRVSGGGSVYHDPGNLNISWILPREEYRAEAMHELFIRALGRLGIQARLGQGGSIVVAEGKISGSAFCYRKDKVLHHGTLLLDADLDLLQAALSPPGLKMHTHAVASVPASVVNLKTLLPELNREQIQDALMQEAESRFGEVEPIDEPGLPADLEHEGVRLASSEWIWAQTPGFHSQVTLQDGRELRFRVHKGKMSELQVNGVTLELERLPDFPGGDFRELEGKLGSAIADVFSQAGWIRI